MPGASLGVAVRLQKQGLELLRSPKASEGQGGALGEAEALKRGNTVGVRDQVMDLVAGQGLKVSRVSDNGLMPTPMSRDYKGDVSPHERNGIIQVDSVERAIFHSGQVKLIGTPRANAANSSSKQVKAGAPKGRLEDQVLLPTPNTMEHLPDRTGEARERQLHRGSSASRRASSGNLREDILEVTTWGKFEPAIKRWEQVLGRPAPAPTKPDGKDDAHRLSSKFTEWMMGLPDGWITDCGLSRNEELKAAGNGVVPQQAELALRILLEGIDWQGSK
jgi:DNA (cytosine-5)-methyltransferase 1